MGDLQAEIVEEPIKIEKGYIVPSTEPGLGIGGVKVDVLGRYLYQPERKRSPFGP